jgi:Flp pilus assembly pilin Flp
VRPQLRAFVRDDSAQDLVEYAYLSLFVGLAGILVWTGIVNVMSTAYAGYDSGTQGLWEPPDPPPPS